MNKKVEQIAKICHEANRAYCETLEDFSQLRWEDAPEWQKESVRSGVRSHLENPGLTPKESHENWMEFKEQEGWTYGEKKDLEKKQHPCFLPYEDLPEEQQMKDFLFSAIVGVFSNSGDGENSVLY